MTDAVTVTHTDRVALISIDDGKANALSKDLIAAIRGAVDTADASPDTKAIVIAGRRGVLSGGFDLNVVRSGDAAAITDMVADGGDLVRSCYAARTPIVAACTGHAVAAGALLLLGCDVRVGTEGPYNIGLPEVNIMMALPAWALTISADRLSRRHLQRATAIGQMYDPNGAVDAGFLDEVTSSHDVVDHAMSIAQRIASAIHPPAYATTITRMRDGVLATMAAQIEADRSA